MLHGVSLDIPAGEITTLLGPNGAGKSTLVLTIGGALPSTAGSISLDGNEMRGAKPEKVRSAGIAVVPEGRRLLPSLTVEDNMKVATYNLPTVEAKAGIDSALELFPELEKRWSTRRLDHCRAVSSRWSCWPRRSRPDRRFMLVDELSLGLAPVIVKRLMPTMEEIARQGVGVLLIEQFAHVALALANRGVGHRRWPYPVLGHGAGAPRRSGTAPQGVPARRVSRSPSRSGMDEDLHVSVAVVDQLLDAPGDDLLERDARGDQR